MSKHGSVIFALCLALSLALVSGQYPLKDGKCPNFNDCRDSEIELTAENIANIWYGKYTIGFFFQANMKCTRINFTPTANLTATFELTEYELSTNEKRSTEGDFVFNRKGNIEFLYTDLSLPFNFTTLTISPNTWVYVACFDCSFFGHPPGIYGYVNSRFPLACGTDTEAAVALNKCGIPIDAFLEHDQANCQFC